MSLHSRLKALFRADEPADPVIAEAVERAVYLVEPRIRQARGYPEKYRRAIAGALAQARHIAQAMPGPIELSPASQAADPFVHALFASPGHMREALQASEALRDYAAIAGCGECHALLSMQRMEKTALGMEAQGDTVRRDVMQRVVYFTDHQFSCPAPSEAGARTNLLWAMFDRFMARVAVGVQRLHDEHARLEGEKDLAVARLRSAKEENSASLQAELGTLLGRLGEAGESLGVKHMAEVFDTVLSHPQDCLALEEHTLILDRMGVVQGNPDNPGAATLHFTDLIERYETQRTVVLVRCPELVPPGSLGSRLEQAAGWLN
jgi:hypothetical protein